MHPDSWSIPSGRGLVTNEVQFMENGKIYRECGTHRDKRLVYGNQQGCIGCSGGFIETPAD